MKKTIFASILLAAVFVLGLITSCASSGPSKQEQRQAQEKEGINQAEQQSQQKERPLTLEQSAQQLRQQLQELQKLSAYIQLYSVYAGTVVVNGQDTKFTARAGAVTEVIIENASGQYTVAVRDSGGTLRQAQAAVRVIRTGPDNKYTAEIIDPNQPANAQEDFDITQNALGGITITGYKGSRRHVVIPAKLYGQDVIAIAPGAFQNKGLISVVIPDTVLLIGYLNESDVFTRNENGVFAGNQLQSVTLGKGLKAIGTSTFKGNKGLTQITIPDSVVAIEQEAFKDCGLTSVRFGKDVIDIRSSAFENNNLTELQLPASLMGIGADAFAGNKIQSLNIPNKVIIVKRNAFKGNPLATLVIPQSLARYEDNGMSFLNAIAPEAFPRTLTRVTLPANMSDQNLSAFESNLANYYKGQGKKAGTYVKNGPVWALQ